MRRDSHKKAMNNHSFTKGGRWKTWATLSLFVFTTACLQPSFYDQNQEITGQEWSNKEVKSFSVPVKDSTSRYAFFLKARHAYTYPFSNLAIRLTIKDQNFSEKEYLVKLKLAENDGKWKGTGTGNLFSMEFPILEGFHFRDTGTYTIQVSHAMETNPLPGIKDIGLRIQKQP